MSVTDGFDSASAIERVSGSSFSWDVLEGWLQGRGAWGGLVIAAQVKAVQALQDEVDAGRRIRNTTAHLFGALPAGRARLDVECLRAGSAMTTWQVRLVGSDDVLAAQAVIITGTSRPVDAGERWGIATMPDLPDRSELGDIPVRPPFGPEFGAHFSYRAGTGFPGSAAEPSAAGWIAPAEGESWPGWNAALLLGIVDAWWPATYVSAASFADVRPMATVSFSAHLLVDPSTIRADEPLGFESWVSDAEDGFTSETRRLWTSDGRLAVENHQAIVIVK